MTPHRWHLCTVRSTTLALLLAIGDLVPANGQEPPAPSLLSGRLFVHWGYNRAIFTRSDIRFTGPDYDFTLRQVKAVDRPEPFSPKNYFAPANIWIPQYNYRVGYFLNERWSVSLGLDHMKYVVAQGQKVQEDGYARNTGTGEWSNTQQITLTPDVLQYEHTDGLNLLSVDADRYHSLWNGGNGRRCLHVFEGAFAGPVIPRTDVRLFGVGLNNRFHLAGWGAGVQAGIHFTFCRVLYLRATAKGGYIDLPDVLTTGTSEDRARQHFFFAQWNATFGATIGW